MALSAKVGNFTRPASGSTDTTVTGLGFAPTCLIFLAGQDTAAGSWRAALQMAVGWAAKQGGDTSTIVNASGSIAANDGTTPASYVSIQGHVTLRDSGGSAQAEAATVAFGSDGFTIDWTNSPYDGEQELVVYLALGGDAQAAANAYSFTAEELLGEAPGRLHGLHFSPDAALVIAQDASGTAAQSFGVAASSQWAIGYAAQSGANPSNTWRRLSDQGAIELLNPTSGARSFAASLAMSRSGMSLTSLGNLAFGSLGSGDANFNTPGQVAVDSSGNIYVADAANNRVKKHDPSGAYIASFTATAATGVAVDSSGNIYVAHNLGTPSGYLSKLNSSFVVQANAGAALGNHVYTDGTYVFSTRAATNQIVRFSTSMGSGITFGTAGSGDGQFNSPLGIAGDGSHIYVADQGNNRIQKFTTSGVFVAKWGTTGGGPGQLNGPRGVAVDASGDIWVADAGNQRLQKFSSTGTWLQTIGLTDTPEGIACQAGNLIVTFAGSHRVTISLLPTIDVDVKALYLGNVIATAGVAAKSTSGAPASQNIATGIRPKAALFGTHADTALNSSAAHLRLSVGVTDGTNVGALVGHIEDNAGTANADTLTLTDRAIAKVNNTSSTVEASATAGISGQDLALTWNPNDAVATRIAWLAIGERNSLDGAVRISFGTSDAPAKLATSAALLGAATLYLGTPEQPAWLGSSSIGTPLLGIVTGDAAATLEIGGAGVSLRIDHGGTLSGLADLSIDASHEWPPQDHEFLSTGGITFSGPEPLLGSTGADLSGSVLLEFGGADPALKAAIRLNGAAQISLTVGSLGLGGADLPTPKELGPDDIMGTVNLFRNPSFEAATLDSNDAAGVASATLAVSTSAPWHGQQHLRVTLPASGSNAGVALKSQRGLPYTARQYGFLGQFRAKASASLSVSAYATVHYTDGSSTVGTSATLPLTTSYAEQHLPVVVSNPAKQVDYISLSVLHPSPASQTIDIDGVQIELDRGHGVTVWAIGTFGEPYHRWQGGAHASITIRDAIPVTSQIAMTSGRYEIQAFMYRVNANNQIQEDLSLWVDNAAVTFDTERDVSWTLECEMRPEGYRKLSPFKDWLAPYMRVTLPDGSVRYGQLGHFVVLPSTREVSETTETVTIDARSPEVLLQMQGTKGYMFVGEGKQLDRAMRVVLRECHLGEDPNGRPRFDIPDKGRQAGRDMTWEKKENTLTILNDLAKKAHLHPIYASKTGVITTADRRDRRLKRLSPVRVFAANVPDGFVDPWVSSAGATTNEVVGAVKLTPNLGKWDDNKIVVVSVNPRKPKIRAVRYITDPDHPLNPKKRKRIKERRVKLDVHRGEDAAALAEAIAEEIGTELETVELSVIPDPVTDYARQVVYCAIFNTRNEPVAVGRFAVKGITWGWTADEFLQTMRLGFVHSVDELQHYDPNGWEISGQWSPV